MSDRRRIERKRFEKSAPKNLRSVSPGDMYKGIPAEREIFEKSETKLVKEKEPRFVRFCKWCCKAMPSLGKGATYKPKYQEAVDFLGWNLKPEEFAAATKLGLFLTLIIGFAFGAIAFFLFGELIAELAGGQLMVFLYIFAPIILIAVVVAYYIQSFPLSAAKMEQLRALSYVPEIVGYLIMSMKLVPNLEKAVEFSAEHGKGKIADEFKRIIWEVQIGVHNTLAEALDELAYRWGKFSPEFKQALMMIRASVLEDTEAKRFALLDKTMENVLDSVKTKMEEYARGLSQPSIILFYLGVLLPLILIIILPIGSAFSGTPMARPEIMILLYNVIIPAVCILFVRNILKSRPITYEAPDIPDNSPFLPPKGSMKLGKTSMNIKAVIVLIIIAGSFGAWYLSSYGIVLKDPIDPRNDTILLAPDKKISEVMNEFPDKEKRFDSRGSLFFELRAVFPDKSNAEIESMVLLKKAQYFNDPKKDVTPYNLIFVSLIVFSVILFVWLYYSNIYKRRVQLEAVQMELEFKDAIYVLASRMGENKPVEEALRHTREFLPNAVISQKLFAKTIDNINLLGMPLEAAIFDPNYGSLKNNPSKLIRSSMKLMIDSVQLGVNVAARTLMSLSLQISNTEKVNQMLKNLVSELSSMMRTMSLFIAPLVLGITTSLQKVVMLTLGNIVSQGLGTETSAIQTSSAISGMGSFESLTSTFAMNPEVFASMVSPGQFIFIVAAYVIEVVIIMVYFTTKIEEENTVLAKVNIAKSLPIAMIVFVIAVLLANVVVGGFMV